MYKLLKPFPNGLTVMVEEVQGHIARIGFETVNGLKGDSIPTMFVDQMLQIHSKYSELIKDIFQNDQEFSSALDKACSQAINYRSNPKAPCKSPELVKLFRFVDFYQPYEMVSFLFVVCVLVSKVVVGIRSVQKLLSRCKSARFYLCVYGYITTTIP